MTGPVVRDAATVLVTRDGARGLEVLLVRRHARSAWLGDLFVFPGGAVDEADRIPEALARVSGAAPGVERAYVYTAARETFEEAGILFADRAVPTTLRDDARSAMLDAGVSFARTLARLQARVDGAQLRYFSRWITPVSEPRRFDARFFVARTPDDQVARADAREVSDDRWLRPADALRAHANGELGMIFPTVTHLQRIADFETVDALLHFAARKTIATVEPDITPAGLALPTALVDAW